MSKFLSYILLFGLLTVGFLSSTQAVYAQNAALCGANAMGVCQPSCNPNSEQPIAGLCTNGMCCAPKTTTPGNATRCGINNQGVCQPSCNPNSEQKIDICRNGDCCAPKTNGTVPGGAGPIINGPETDDPTGSLFGTITPPKGTEKYSPNGEIGLLNFISMLVRIFTVVAGIIVFFNFILSGYTYVTSDGNAKAAETVRTRLTYSIIGLVLIVSAYVITALISLIIFGDAGYILNPTITPPETVTTP